MTIVDYAVAIKNCVYMPDVLQKYGFGTGKHRRIPCPFHNGKDNNLSYNRTCYHCFVCGAKGDIIGFIQNYFDLSFYETINKINIDFCLNLPIGESTSNETLKKIEEKTQKLKEKRIEELRRKQELENNYWNAFDGLKLIKDVIRANRPLSPYEKPSELFIYALQELSYQEYLFDLAESEIISYERKNNNYT